MNTITTDLAKFGVRERRMVEELLKAWREQGLPEDFYNEKVTEKVTVMMNMQSGCVFLTNSEFQVAMMNDNKLESFYSCLQCGHEGFLEEMWHNPEDNECNEYCNAIGAEPNKDEWKNMSISTATHIVEDILRSIQTFNTVYAKDTDLTISIEEALNCTDEEEQSIILNEDVWNVLNQIAPEGYYFGAHPGNGSDFGFWEITEELV